LWAIVARKTPYLIIPSTGAPLDAETWDDAYREMVCTWGILESLTWTVVPLTADLERQYRRE
jgi:hypothetical protein